MFSLTIINLAYLKSQLCLFGLILSHMSSFNVVFTCVGCGSSPSSDDDEQSMKLFIEKGTVFLYVHVLV